MSVRVCSVLAAGALALAACQNLQMGGRAQAPESAEAPPPVSEPQDRGGSVPAPSQELPPVSGPRYPEAEPVPEPDSAWRKALEPFLNGEAGETVEPQPERAAPEPIPLPEGVTRVGVLLPLTGPNAPLGRGMFDAAQMAMFDFGEEGLELLPQDTRGTPGEASFAATLVIGDGAGLIVGPLLASSVKAATPIAQAAGVPVIGFSSDRAVAGDGVYTMGFLPEAEVERVVTYAYSRGITRFAVLAPDDAYGTRVAGALRATTRRIGAELVDAAFYEPSGADIEPVVRRLADYDRRKRALADMRRELQAKDDELSKKALERLAPLETMGDLPYQALLIADGGKRLQRVAALLPFYDIDPAKVRILGTGQWDVPGIGAEPALVGAWFAAPPHAARAGFEQRFAELYGEAPPRLATLAYDATALAAVLARDTPDGIITNEAITQPSGFAGRDGIFRFRPSCVVERGLAVYQAGQKDNTVIDPAPKSFQPMIN